MKVIELFETEKKDKPRPPKTLWFKHYPLWVHDITTRFPDAQAHKNEEEEEVVALDSTGNKCYGIWRSKKGQGVSYAGARPLHTVIHPRTPIAKV